MPGLDLQPDLCRQRQRRLIEHIHAKDIDLAVVLRPEHVRWLTGYLGPWQGQPAAALRPDGHCTLIVPHKTPEWAAADDVLAYPAKRHSTWRNDQGAAAAEALWEQLATRPAAKRVGVEFSICGPHFTGRCGDLADIEPAMVQFRRRKDADEVALLKKAIAATGRMYDRGERQIVEPGVNELDVFNDLQAVAVREYGEMLTGTGNDYQCRSRGGPPRDRAAQAGELYILDLGPAYRGYFADTCRTLCVGGQPTDRQTAAWQQIVPLFAYIEATVRPGVRCREVFDEVQRRLDAWLPGSFNHHLGHGIGLSPHEGPHLNPFWDDTFEVGDVFTVEPGLYAPELQAGMRLENDYLVTETGVELLSDFALEL